MCGICGDVDLAGTPDAEGVRRAARAIAHRGPDAEAFFFDGPAGLGHRRLAILDLESGDQPMVRDAVAVVLADPARGASVSFGAGGQVPAPAPLLGGGRSWRALPWASGDAGVSPPRRYGGGPGPPERRAPPADAAGELLRLLDGAVA